MCWRAAAQAIKESGLPEASVVTVHLCGNLHKDELRALKYIARELCQFCGYNFTNSASVDDNIKFLEHVLQKISRYVLLPLDMSAHDSQDGLTNMASCTLLRLLTNNDAPLLTSVIC